LRRLLRRQRAIVRRDFLRRFVFRILSSPDLPLFSHTTTRIFFEDSSRSMDVNSLERAPTSSRLSILTLRDSVLCELSLVLFWIWDVHSGDGRVDGKEVRQRDRVVDEGVSRRIWVVVIDG